MIITIMQLNAISPRLLYRFSLENGDGRGAGVPAIMALVLGGNAPPLDEQQQRRDRRVRQRGADDNGAVAKTSQGVPASSKALYTLMMKMLLSLAQSRRNIEGVLFDVLIVPQDLPEVLKMTEQGSLYNQEVQKRGKGHGLGAPHLWIFGALLESLLLRKESIGAHNFAELQKFKQKLTTLEYAQKMDIIKFTKVDKCYDQGKRRITLCIAEARPELLSALQQIGAELKSGRAPASHMERELQEWLDVFLS